MRGHPLRGFNRAPGDPEGHGAWHRRRRGPCAPHSAGIRDFGCMALDSRGINRRDEPPPPPRPHSWLRSAHKWFGSREISDFRDLLQPRTEVHGSQGNARCAGGRDGTFPRRRRARERTHPFSPRRGLSLGCRALQCAAARAREPLVFQLPNHLCAERSHSWERGGGGGSRGLRETSTVTVFGPVPGTLLRTCRTSLCPVEPPKGVTPHTVARGAGAARPTLPQRPRSSPTPQTGRAETSRSDTARLAWSGRCESP